MADPISIKDLRAAAAKQGKGAFLSEAAFDDIAQMMKSEGLDGALVIIPAWREMFSGPVEEFQLPDGERLSIVLSAPIPEGRGILITCKGDKTEMRMCTPEDDGGGRLSVTVPIDAAPAPMRWAVSGPERPQ